MSRSFLLSPLAALLLAAGVAWAAPAWSAPAIVRGNLILDGIPEQSALTADKLDKLDAYLSAREARPQGFTAKGQLLDRHAASATSTTAPRRSAARRAPADHVYARPGI